jgi:hypothetical protein
MEKVSPLTAVAGSVPTVNVGVLEAELALMEDDAPFSPAVVVLPSKRIVRLMNWFDTTPDAVAPAMVRAEVGIEVVEAPVVTVPRAIAFVVLSRLLLSFVS